MPAATSYVQARDGNLYVGASRVTLDSIVLPWREHASPETIQADFPTVPLADIYGAIAYYLEHRDEVAARLREGDEIYERERVAQQAADPEFYARMRERLARALPVASSVAPSMASLRGIARMETPPDDDTVERWLDEHRIDKYS
jgi:uncharacterized protein (DUF433 family)